MGDRMKTKYWKEYYGRKKSFLGAWLTGIGALPITADDDLARIVQQAFNAGWDARKQAEYIGSFNSGDSQ
jgi:hypothetical protein